MTAPWFALKSLPVCRCGYTMTRKGMLRDLQADKNNRPGPAIVVTHSSVATIRMDCRVCGRSWDARFLSVDRFERQPFAPPVPIDCYPLGPEDKPEEVLRSILAERRRKEEVRRKSKERRAGHV